MNTSDLTTTRSTVAETANVRAFVARVFMWMSAGMAVTAILAWPLGHNTAFVDRIASNGWLFLGLFGASFLLLFWIGSVVQRTTNHVYAGTLFLAFSALWGVILAPTVAYYSDASLVTCFAVSGGMFGVMGAAGYFTQLDLSRFRAIFLMGLVGIVIAMLINLFIASQTATLVISILGVLLFCGLTAYDMQRIKLIAQTAPADSPVAVMGAVALYLDLLNMMLFLLRIFGARR